MQAKVPQNVDMEDRVVGMLTLRQFMLLLAAGGIDMGLYVFFKDTFMLFFILFGGLVTAIACAFAFYRPTEQPLEVLALAFVRSLREPQKMVWKKESDLPPFVRKAPKPKDDNERTSKPLAEVRSDLERLAHIVDSGTLSSLDKKNRLMTNELPKEPDPYDAFSIQSQEAVPYDPEIMEMVQKRPPKKDPLISDVASISPTKQFEYPQINTASDSFLADVR